MGVGAHLPAGAHLPCAGCGNNYVSFTEPLRSFLMRVPATVWGPSWVLFSVRPAGGSLPGLSL